MKSYERLQQLEDECKKRGLRTSAIGLIRHVTGNAALTAAANTKVDETNKLQLIGYWSAEYGFVHKKHGLLGPPDIADGVPVFLHDDWIDSVPNTERCK